MHCTMHCICYIVAMRLRDKLSIISELQAIRIQYGLSYEQLAFDLRDHVELSTTTIYRMLRAGTAKRVITTGVEAWLKKEGRRRYPIESLAEAKGGSA